MSLNTRGRGSRNRGDRGRRQMELIASVSRSSGLEKDGDALKNFATQEKYRAFIQDRLDDFWQRYPRKGVQSTNQRDTQENILILFRKLREGLISSKRSDKFAVEVYETSLYLAVLFDSPRQTTSILSHLIQDLYSINSTLLRPLTILISLLHHLVAAYPSQSTFRQHLDSLPAFLLPPSSELYLWIASLASSLRTLNYFKIEQLTRPDSFSHLLVSPQTEGSSFTTESTAISPSTSFQPSINLATEAIHTLVDSLRAKTREKTWGIIRSAYRELLCNPESETTHRWLERSLVLAPVVPGASVIRLDQWLVKKSQEGQVRRKEGAVDGRWVVCKLR